MEEGSFSFRAAQKHALDQLMRDKKIVEEANTVGTNKITEPGCMCYCQKTDEKVLEHLGPLFPYCGAGCLKSDAKAAYISAGTSYYLRDLKTLSLLSILLFILCIPMMVNFGVLNSVAATSPNGTYTDEHRLYPINPLAQKLFPEASTFASRKNPAEVSALPAFFMGALTFRNAKLRYASDPLIMAGVFFVMIFSTAVALGMCGAMRFLSMRSEIAVANSDDSHYTPSDYTLRVRNLPSNATALEIAAYFSTWGQVREVQFYDSARRWFDPAMVAAHSAATKSIAMAEQWRTENPRPHRLDAMEERIEKSVETLQTRARALYDDAEQAKAAAAEKGEEYFERSGIAFVSFDDLRDRARALQDHETVWGSCIRCHLPENMLWIESILEPCGGGPCKIDGAHSSWFENARDLHANGDHPLGQDGPIPGSTEGASAAGSLAQMSTLPQLDVIPIKWKLPRRTCCAGKCGAPDDISPCFRVDVPEAERTSCVCYATNLPTSLIVRRAHEPGEVKWANLMVKGIKEWWRGFLLFLVVTIYIIILLAISSSYLIGTTYFELKNKAGVDILQQAQNELNKGGNGTSLVVHRVSESYVADNKWYAFGFQIAISICKTIYSQLIIKVCMKKQRKHTETDEQETLLLLYVLQESLYFFLYSTIAVVTLLAQYNLYTTTLEDRYLFASYSVADAYVTFCIAGMITDVVMGLINTAPINLRRRIFRLIVCSQLCKCKFCPKGQEEANQCWAQPALPPYHLHMSAVKSLMLSCTVGMW